MPQGSVSAAPGRQGVNLPMPERYGLRIDHAVAYSGLSKSTLYDLVRQGKLASTKIGNRRLIFRESLEALLKASTSKEACG